MFLPIFFLYNFGFYETGFGLFPGVLEGFGISGRLVGSISTDPGTYLCPGSRVMTKNPRGAFFYRPREIRNVPSLHPGALKRAV